MGDNYCTTAASSDKVEENKGRQAVDYIFTDQAPESLEDDDSSACASKSSILSTAVSENKGESNTILKRIISIFSFTSWRGRPK